MKNKELILIVLLFAVWFRLDWYETKTGKTKKGQCKSYVTEQQAIDEAEYATATYSQYVVSAVKCR